MSNSILDAMAVEYESGAHRSNAEAERDRLKSEVARLNLEVLKAKGYTIITVQEETTPIA